MYACVALCNVYLPSLAPYRLLICANRWHKMRWLAFCGGIFLSFIELYVFFLLIYFFGCWCFLSFHSTERNKKRDIRNWYQSANDRYNDAIEDKPRDTLRRGDIPILHGDCDGECVAAIHTFHLCGPFGRSLNLILLDFSVILSHEINTQLKCFLIGIYYFSQISCPKRFKICWHWSNCCVKKSHIKPMKSIICVD